MRFDDIAGSLGRLVLPVLALAFLLHCLALSFRRPVRHGEGRRPWHAFWTVWLFGCAAAAFSCLAGGGDSSETALLWILFLSLQWLILIFAGRMPMQAALTGFFLSDLGLAVMTVTEPEAMERQLLCICVGILGFILIRILLKQPRLVTKLRIPAAVGCIGILLATLVLAEPINGARCWLTIGGVSFQPPELAKVLFVIAVALPEEPDAPKRNLILITLFSAVCVVLHVLMNDFGSALVLFAAYLAAITLRRYGILTGLLGLGCAVVAVLAVLRFGGHAAERFATWGRAWELMNDSGYQQTRAMAAAAGGGLFGLGLSGGWLSGIFAGNTDLVFCLVCEKMGFVIAGTTVLLVLFLALQLFLSAGYATSPLRLSCGCTAVMILVTLTALHVLGSVDLLPFTGVTLPLVSRGGTSAVAVWCLLAFAGSDYRTDTARETAQVLTAEEPDADMESGEAEA